MTLALIRSELLKVPDITEGVEVIFNQLPDYASIVFNDSTDFSEEYKKVLGLVFTGNIPLESRDVGRINTVLRIVKPYVDLAEDFYFI
jgi:hypothetical protein